ncbi:MAG: cell division protein ZapE [Gammaproteobacteria bacterium]|nr:cell division protein ZapE [Gammaproteobacteria bacterium]
MHEVSLAQKFRQILAANNWQADDAQWLAVAALDQLLNELHAPQRFWSRAFRKSKPVPKGLYLWGGVGRGKTFLMDLFYAELHNVPKMRQHFHRFIKDVHHQLKTTGGLQDPLQKVATRLRARAKVICFDEFFVSDIADAMILGRLFDALFDLGIVLVATSNSPPDKLYRGGLQRSRFLPAIAALKRHNRIVQIDGGKDYRLLALRTMDIFHYPHDTHAQRQLEEYFCAIAPDQGTRSIPIRLEGRDVPTVRRADGIIWFTFAALCDGPRGVADYMEIARTFHTVIVSEIPQLDVTLENQARRFIALVDEFYDRSVNLIISAAVPLSQLYTGRRLRFEFERTASRLVEMQGNDYLALPHVP